MKKERRSKAVHHGNSIERHAPNTEQSDVGVKGQESSYLRRWPWRPNNAIKPTHTLRGKGGK